MTLGSYFGVKNALIKEKNIFSNNTLYYELKKHFYIDVNDHQDWDILEEFAKLYKKNYLTLRFFFKNPLCLCNYILCNKTNFLLRKHLLRLKKLYAYFLVNCIRH